MSLKTLLQCAKCSFTASLAPQLCGHALGGEPTTCFPQLQLPVPIKRHLEAERRWAPSADTPEIRPELLSLPSPRMKTLFTFLFLMVSVTLAVEGLSATPSTQPNDQKVDPGPTRCCFAYMTRPVPLSRLKSFEYTNGRCSKPAVVFITKKGRTICADPSEQWVQDRIRALTPP
ncbi:C-C motif chemokine 4-like [Crotalus tigris]|uniref:C-C motif chemokine 4-like n=1 Tax=Crotalus tigris TaxID=88082 RepID=UPI00192F9450|nr:C-C motif chemokine 4-like [Crotalus tigris]